MVRNMNPIDLLSELTLQPLPAQVLKICQKTGAP